MPAAFPKIKAIRFEGPDSKNPLAFKHYNPDEIVEGKSMKDHLRFSAVYWHTMRGMGSDMFGIGTMRRPWEDGTNSVKMALKRVPVMFEFCQKLGVAYYAFHDRDVAPEGRNLRESNKNLDVVAKELKKFQRETGIKLLWGTACLFVNPRFMHGAATSPNADVFAYAAAQVKKALEVTHDLKGEGYTFWGGREGYSTLLNTNMKRELDHLAAFLHMAVEHKKKIGFKGQFYIEPKPKEPTKHQYDSDAAACINFLRAYDLLDARNAAGDSNTAIVRIEQLYPFPGDPLVKRLERMTNLEEVIWAQEEPRNNGSWFFVEELIEECLKRAKVAPKRPRYAGRKASAATATGLAKRHQAEQAALVADALGHNVRAEIRRQRKG